MSTPPIEVQRQGPEQFDEVVETLCDAFHDYPVMRFVLRDAGKDYERQLRSLIGYFTDSRISRGWPVLGVREATELLAVANVNPPRSAPAPASLEQRYARMCKELGDAAIARFLAFAEASEPFAPEQSHYYLGMLGVRRQHQGRGLARLLLDELHGMSAGDPDSAGVALTTETPRNLPLYEHFGYRILGLAEVDDLRTWTMFRPDP